MFKMAKLNIDADDIELSSMHSAPSGLDSISDAEAPIVADTRLAEHFHSESMSASGGSDVSHETSERGRRLQGRRQQPQQVVEGQTPTSDERLPFNSPLPVASPTAPTTTQFLTTHSH